MPGEGEETISPSATASASASPTASATASASASATASASASASASPLPDTGGPNFAGVIALPALALLVAGGLLARRLVRD